MSEKLQKVLARSGQGSRREIELMIQNGRVSIDGKVAKLGDRLDDLSVNVRIDGTKSSWYRLQKKFAEYWRTTNLKVNYVPVTIQKVVVRCLIVCLA